MTKVGEPFALAGLWENWRVPGIDQWMRTFCNITATANELIAQIHDLMPVIIPPAVYDRWLSSIEPNPRDLLIPFPAGHIKMWPISTRVNKPENDEASILEPAETDGPGIL